jgi:hypothetical protein
MQSAIKRASHNLGNRSLLGVEQLALPLTRISKFADILLSPFQGSFFLTSVQGFRFASPLAILYRASGANLHDRRYLRNLA